MDHRAIQERVQMLKQEIDDIRRLNEQYWQRNLRTVIAKSQYEARRERLAQIKDELRSLGKSFL